MSDTRDQKCTLLLGGLKSGKSTYSDKKIDRYPSDKKCLIVDRDGTNKIWWKYPLITINEVGTFKGKKRIIYDNENRDFIKIIKNKFRNGLLVYDDAKVYIQRHNKPDFETQLISMRSFNIDIFFSYHGFSKVPELVWGYVSHVVLFRMEENPAMARDFLKVETQLWVDRWQKVMKMRSEENPFPRKIYQRIGNF